MKWIILFSAFILFLLVLSVLRYLALVRKSSRPSPGKRKQAEKEQIRRFCEAIAIPTVSHSNPEENDKEAFELWEHFLDSNYPLINTHLKRKKLNELAYYYIWEGSRPEAGNVLMLAHFDVVPVDADKWERSPFSGEQDESYIYGRGTLDTKNTLVSVLEAAEQLLSEGFQPEKNIYFAFGGDEEVVGTRGASVIAAHFEKQGITFDWLLDEGAVIAEGMLSFIKSPTALIGVAEKGFASLRLSSVSEGGHAAMPPAITSIGRISRAVARLEKHPQPFRILPVVKKMLQAMVPRVSFPLGFLFANLWLFGGLILLVLKKSPKTAAMVHTTVAPTIVKGGIKDNVLAREAEAVLNIRILPGETYQECERRIKSIIADDKVNIELLTDSEMAAPVAESDSGGEGFQQISEVVKSLVDKAVVLPYLVTATTDSKKYINCVKQIYHLAPMILDSEELSLIHNHNERISVDNYAFGIQFYSELFRKQ